MNVILVAFLSFMLSLVSAVGVNLQKFSMNKEELQATSGEGSSRQRPPYCQPLWIVGLSTQIVDAIGDFIFMGLAPQALLAPLGALYLGFNVILAPLFHPNETATRNTWIATGWIYAGVIVTVLFAPRINDSYDLQSLILLLKEIPFWVYVALCLAIVAGLMLHGHYHGYNQLYYCALAGYFGGWNVLFAKSSSELVQNAIATRQPDDWISSPIPYLLVVGMIGSIVTNLRFLNVGLAKFEALLVVPVYQSFFNAFSITGGLIFFQEYKHMSIRDGLVYALGIAITMVGVTLLIRERSREIRLVEAVGDPPSNEEANDSGCGGGGNDVEEGEQEPAIRNMILDRERNVDHESTKEPLEPGETQKTG